MYEDPAMYALRRFIGRSGGCKNVNREGVSRSIVRAGQEEVNSHREEQMHSGIPLRSIGTRRRIEV